MKEAKLREIAVCKLCGKKIGHTGLPLFWRVRTEHWGIRIDAIKRQQGLAMVLGGHAVLAGVMGPDEEMAEKLSTTEITVCEECCTKQVWVVMLAEE